MGPWRAPGVSLLHSTEKHLSQEPPRQESDGLPSSSPQDLCAATQPTPAGRNAGVCPQGWGHWPHCCHIGPASRSLVWCDPAPIPHLHPLTRPESHPQSLGSSCGACHQLTAGAEWSQRRAALHLQPPPHAQAGYPAVSAGPAQLHSADLCLAAPSPSPPPQGPGPSPWGLTGMSVSSVTILSTSVTEM